MVVLFFKSLVFLHCVSGCQLEPNKQGGDSRDAEKLGEAEWKQLCGVHTGYRNRPWPHQFQLVLICLSASDTAEVLQYKTYSGWSKPCIYSLNTFSEHLLQVQAPPTSPLRDRIQSLYILKEFRDCGWQIREQAITKEVMSHCSARIRHGQCKCPRRLTLLFSHNSKLLQHRTYIFLFTIAPVT